MKNIRAAWPFAFATLLLTSLLTGCSDQESGPVRYSGNNLYVDGIAYAREPASGETFAAGLISLQPQEGMSAELHSLLRRLGLKIIGQRGRHKTSLIVEVTPGFEQQWSLALSNFPEVAFAALETQPIAPFDAVSVSDETSRATTTPSAALSTPPPGEPAEADLQHLQFQLYSDINQAGGMPATATATGSPITLRPTLYSVRKESCKRRPNVAHNAYQCSLTLSLSLAEDGSDPSEQGARISVKWDSTRGEWVIDK